MSVRKILVIAGGAVIAALILLGVFALGVQFGTRRATYVPTVVPGNGALPPAGMGYGIMGTVQEIDTAARTLVVVTQKGHRFTVAVEAGTLLERGHKRIELEAVKTGEVIVAIGSPGSEGRVTARVIRVLAPPPRPVMFLGINVTPLVRLFNALTHLVAQWFSGR